MDSLVVQYFECFFDLSWILNAIAATKSTRYCYEVDDFPPLSDRKSGICSTEICIRLFWMKLSRYSIKLSVLCCEKNSHLIRISILSLKWVHPGSTTILLTPTVILIRIWVKIIFSCTDSFRFQVWRRKIQKWSFLICSSTSNQNIKSRFIFQIFMISCVNTPLVKVETPVERVKLDGWPCNSICRSKVDIWTNPVGVWSIRKRFKRKWS